MKIKDIKLLGKMQEIDEDLFRIYLSLLVLEEKKHDK